MPAKWRCAHGACRGDTGLQSSEKQVREQAVNCGHTADVLTTQKKYMAFTLSEQALS